MATWNKIPSGEVIAKTVQALKANGMEALVVSSGNEAGKMVIGMLPKGAEVMTMSSVTLDTIGVTKEVSESGRFDAVRLKLYAIDRKTQGDVMQKLGAAPTWAVGSVHAVTQNGQVVIASNTGSQLPAYAYGSQHVVWVVGAQKIVASLDDAFKRIIAYTLPLESERAKKAYGAPGSNVSKLLVINKEIVPGRITVILVKEVLGF